MVIMGGAATLWGPCLGAAVIVLVQSFASIYSPERWPLILGAIFVICVMFVKGGFAHRLTRLWDRTAPRASRDALPDAVANEGES
jgi:branched-chain amino acid transport system permease protein